MEMNRLGRSLRYTRYSILCSSEALWLYNFKTNLCNYKPLWTHVLSSQVAVRFSVPMMGMQTELGLSIKRGNSVEMFTTSVPR